MFLAGDLYKRPPITQTRFWDVEESLESGWGVATHYLLSLSPSFAGSLRWNWHCYRDKAVFLISQTCNVLSSRLLITPAWISNSLFEISGRRLTCQLGCFIREVVFGLVMQGNTVVLGWYWMPLVSYPWAHFARTLVPFCRMHVGGGVPIFHCWSCRQTAIVFVCFVSTRRCTTNIAAPAIYLSSRTWTENAFVRSPGSDHHLLTMHSLRVVM